MQQALCLSELNQRNAELGIHGPAQMPSRDIKLIRELVDVKFVQCAILDAPQCQSGKTRNGVDFRISRSQLRATNEAGPETRLLLARRVHMERAILKT